MFPLVQKLQKSTKKHWICGPKYSVKFYGSRCILKAVKRKLKSKLINENEVIKHYP